MAFYFQFTTPARKLTHKMKFEHVWMQKGTKFGNATILRYFRPEKHQNQTQTDTNFGNAMILCYFRQEKCQKSDSERHKFQERHNSSLLWARESPNPTVKDMNFAQNCTHLPQQKCQQNKESIHFSRISHIV